MFTPRWTIFSYYSYFVRPYDYMRMRLTTQILRMASYILIGGKPAFLLRLQNGAVGQPCYSATATLSAYVQTQYK